MMSDDDSGTLHTFYLFCYIYSALHYTHCACIYHICSSTISYTPTYDVAFALRCTFAPQVQIIESFATFVCTFITTFIPTYLLRHIFLHIAVTLPPATHVYCAFSTYCTRGSAVYGMPRVTPCIHTIRGWVAAHPVRPCLPWFLPFGFFSR